MTENRSITLAATGVRQPMSPHRRASSGFGSGSSPMNHPQSSRHSSTSRLGLAALTLLGSLGAGCAPPVIEKPGSKSTTDSSEPLDGRGLFEFRVKGELAGSCSCHGAGVSGFDAILKAGAEYDSVTGYRGGLLIPSSADQSPLARLLRQSRRRSSKAGSMSKPPSEAKAAPARRRPRCHLSSVTTTSVCAS